VDSVNYIYDNNGNLLNDGASTYTYDSANRLISFTNATTTVTYRYRCNGVSRDAWGVTGCQSDRVSQTVNGTTTNYVLDLASPLTQVLSDGTNTYLYGVDRIAQVNGTATEYFLPDALGSVRQLVNSAGNITLARSYQPYGTAISSVGNGYSNYGFTGEMTDPTGLIYLRARYYDPADGRFFQQDPSRQEKNLYQYAGSSPTMFTDPSGLVYLTFDDGPNYPADMQILNILKQYNARATFFFHGSHISPSILDKLIIWRVVTEGHRIGNHGWAPELLTKTNVDNAVQSVADTDNQIVHVLKTVKTNNYFGRFENLDYQTQSYINGVIEHGTGLFRPHGGEISLAQLNAIKCMGRFGRVECDSRLRGPLDHWHWDVDPRDWEMEHPHIYNTIPSDIVTRLCYGVSWSSNIGPISIPRKNDPVTSNNDVILLHSYDGTVKALPDVLEFLKSEGYTFDVLEPSWR
jgi:RHS repeat-associated protein